MRSRSALFGLVAALVCLSAGDALACGDKFLVAGRGTRYQRPKNARAASVLIYANPASGLPVAVGKVPLETVLKREGHRSARVETLDELTAIVAGGRFDVVLVANSVVKAVTDFLGRGPDAPVVVAFCAKAGGQDAPERDASCVRTPPKEGPLLKAIDEAVAQRDRMLRRTQQGG